MKIRTTDGETLDLRVTDLDGRHGVMLHDVETGGGKRIAKGTKVKIEAWSRFVRMWTPTCEHCGVSFACRIYAREAMETLLLLPAEVSS